jgi:pimeloyl-ACP methyl ester carboxylesterase
VRHPERVSRLVLYGTSAKFLLTAEERQRWEAMVTLVRSGWGSGNPAFRKMFISLLVPDGDEITRRVLDELFRISANSEDAANFLSAAIESDVTALAPQVRAPTLVIHRRGDQVVPFERGRDLAALIPGARFLVRRRPKPHDPAR